MSNLYLNNKKGINIKISRILCPGSMINIKYALNKWIIVLLNSNSNNYIIFWLLLFSSDF